MEETVVASPIAKTTDVIAEAHLGDTLIGSGIDTSGDGWVILVTATIALSVAVFLFVMMGFSRNEKTSTPKTVTSKPVTTAKVRPSYAALKASTMSRPRLIQ